MFHTSPLHISGVCLLPPIVVCLSHMPAACVHRVALLCGQLVVAVGPQAPVGGGTGTAAQLEARLEAAATTAR